MVRYAMAAALVLMAAGEARGGYIFRAEDGQGRTAWGSLALGGFAFYYSPFDPGPGGIVAYENDFGWVVIDGVRYESRVTFATISNDTDGSGTFIGDGISATFTRGSFSPFLTIGLFDRDGTAFSSRFDLRPYIDLSEFEVRTVSGIFNGTITQFAIPEPPSLALAAPALLAGLAAWRWRRRGAA